MSTNSNNLRLSRNPIHFQELEQKILEILMKDPDDKTSIKELLEEHATRHAEKHTS